tara:strand:+ start:611 stop:877 length:267 start_codon:yes stop_codon:yes gene_type:complete
MKTFIHGVGLKDLPKDEADKIKARQESKELDNLRLVRNRLLVETDFYANTDVTMTDNMKAYRQELRDITKTFKSMNDKDFKFPTKPTD